EMNAQNRSANERVDVTCACNRAHGMSQYVDGSRDQRRAKASHALPRIRLSQEDDLLNGQIRRCEANAPPAVDLEVAEGGERDAHVRFWLKLKLTDTLNGKACAKLLVRLIVDWPILYHQFHVQSSRAICF